MIKRNPSRIGRAVVAVIVLVLCGRSGSLAATTSDLNLVPRPVSVEVTEGVLRLTGGSRVVATDASLAPLAAVISDEIFTVTGVRLQPVEAKPAPGDVALTLDGSLHGESYTLRVGDRAVVAGGNYNAVATGTVTLLQVLRGASSGLSVPHLHVTDHPAYPYRAVMIDLARKYHSPGGIEQVIELARFYKINNVHLHLTDDNLFMFPSTKFPNVGKSNREFARFEPGSEPHVKPYTLEELKGLEAFAKARGVYLVPELDLPGHSSRLVHDAPDVFAFPGNGSTVNIASDKTMEGVRTLLNEVMDVFQSTPYIHLGGDEVGLSKLDRTPEYKRMKEDLGLKNTHEAYCRFFQELHDIAAKRGKKVIVWEEAWSSHGRFPLPKDAAVMIWSQNHDPASVLKAGNPVINAGAYPLYLVRNKKKSMETLFNWQVRQFKSKVLSDTRGLSGVEVCSWENSEATEIQSLRDRLALVGERAWNPEAGGTLESFKARLAHTDAILEKLVNPITIGLQGKLIGDENTFADPITITLTPKAPDARLTIRYTLDNSLPNANWKTYTGPLHIDGTAFLRAGLFDSSGRQHGYLVGGWYHKPMPTHKKH